MDGGVVNNTPISHAVELGADEVWVVATGYACALDMPPRGALGVALHVCLISVPPTDFGQADDLIRRAREHTRMWLERGNVGGSVTAITADKLADPYRHPHAVRRIPRAR